MAARLGRGQPAQAKRRAILIPGSNAPRVYVRVGGVWTPATAVYVRVGGVWTVASVWVQVSSTWTKS